LRAWCLALVLSLLTATGSPAAELKIATWNLNWLTTRLGGLPDDVKLRQPEDFDRLQAYARELDADLIAIEEVDSAETAQLVFPPELYSIDMSHDRVRQRVGIAVRRGIQYDTNPDVTAIALDPMAHLRSGVDITLQLTAGPVRVLAVHLKQGCQYLNVTRSPRNVCVTLMAQFDVVAHWIAARRDEGASFMVLGDFNRGMDNNDKLIAELQAAAPLARATEGFTSPCWGHESFIDHILVGGPAKEWVVPNSLRVLAYRETEPSWKERLSDHCPVSVRLAVPG
jgi:endonuclease/exonuclease/phosphatase family metal-dependent hydrolase